MKITILTIFPELFTSFLESPVLARAIRKNILEFEIIDIKEYAEGSFRHIDDSPYGGGAGMVMRAKPIIDALNSVKNENTYTLIMSPAGKPYSQKIAHELAQKEHIVLICGHYEGIDARVNKHTDGMISIGDYILTGGEPAAMIVADSVVRLLDGALRKKSTEEESFEQGILEYPQYTQPYDFEGDKVPDVLLSGNHRKIEEWKRKEALRVTYINRPDLLKTEYLDETDICYLDQITREESKK